MTIKCPECKSSNISLYPSTVYPIAWSQEPDGQFTASIGPGQVGSEEGQAFLSCADCTLEFKADPSLA